MFRFKQFIVHDDHCGLKVGTDAVLLGTEPITIRPRRVLDIGTGSGVVALMMAQRFPEADVTGIDILPEAVQEAGDNFAASPFADRLHAVHASLQAFASEPQHFDLIVCNPPYFVDSLKNPDNARRIARHTDTLSFSELLEGVQQLLTRDGVFLVILPADAEPAIADILMQQASPTPHDASLTIHRASLAITHRTLIRTTERKAPKRVILTMQHYPASPAPITPIGPTDVLTLMGPDNAPRSAAYATRASEFYL